MRLRPAETCLGQPGEEREATVLQSLVLALVVWGLAFGLLQLQVHFSRPWMINCASYFCSQRPEGDPQLFGSSLFLTGLLTISGYQTKGRRSSTLLRPSDFSGI